MNRYELYSIFEILKFGHNDRPDGSVMFKTIKKSFKKIKDEIDVYKMVLKDRRTPKLAKVFLGIAIGYFFLPFDIIPDFIPVLGQLDDLIIVTLFVFLALKMIPKNVIEDCRKKSYALKGLKNSIHRPIKK
jgi:uncharacterized membrane protein YkvA (DUF1232 family)